MQFSLLWKLSSILRASTVSPPHRKFVGVRRRQLGSGAERYGYQRVNHIHFLIDQHFCATIESIVGCPRRVPLSPTAIRIRGGVTRRPNQIVSIWLRSHTCHRRTVTEEFSLFDNSPHILPIRPSSFLLPVLSRFLYPETRHETRLRKGYALGDKTTPVSVYHIGDGVSDFAVRSRRKPSNVDVVSHLLCPIQAWR